MKFIIDTPERSRQELQSFPEYFQKGFLSTRKLFMLCQSDNGDTIAACGLADLSNYLLIYVDKGWRERGIATRILGKTIRIARNRGFNFIALAVGSSNVAALRLYSRFSFREVADLREYGFKVMILPLTSMGEVAYALSRAFCSILPKSFLVHTVVSMRSAISSIREWF